jgi:hypothetical protein
MKWLYYLLTFAFFFASPNFYLPFVNCVFSLCCFRRRCPYWATGAVSGTGLPRAGTGRCYLAGLAAWWGFRVTSSTRILFGGSRVGQTRCSGSRPPMRWYVAVSGRRTSTSVGTWPCWRGSTVTFGRFVRGCLFTRAMSLWWFLLFGCALRPPLSSPRFRTRLECLRVFESMCGPELSEWTK